jgi:argininosuccinate lyase
MQAIEPRITRAALAVLAVDKSVASRMSYGGTAPKNVRAQAQRWLKRLESEGKSAKSSAGRRKPGGKA